MKSNKYIETQKTYHTTISKFLGSKIGHETIFPSHERHGIFKMVRNHLETEIDDDIDGTLVKKIVDELIHVEYYLDLEKAITYKNNEDEIEIPAAYKKQFDQYKYLKSIPYVLQKSAEWLKMREDLVTASDVAASLGKSKYDSKNSLLKKKTGVGKPFMSNKWTAHGTKYEDIAAMIYSAVYNVITGEFGLIKSKKYPFLGASPDRICTWRTVDNKFSQLVARMLEIKCVFGRKIITIGEIDDNICPHGYWIQVQVQLAVCELMECDFFQAEIIEYKSRQEWLTDINPKCEFSQEQNISVNIKHTLKRGCIIQLRAKNNPNPAESFDFRYLYPPTVDMTTDEYDSWVLDNIYNFDKTHSELSKDWVFDKVLYWRLAKAHNCLIVRDDKWFAENINTISEFWDRVLQLRKNENELKAFVDKTTRKPKLDANGNVIKRKSKYAASEDGSCFIDDEDDPYTDAVPKSASTSVPINNSTKPAASKRTYTKRAPVAAPANDDGCFIDD
ncbi:MAG: putative phage-type endonuclease [Faunusvirus sp.]|jgi:putative phage-type endonuclease|uniref:Putative phage-type endonuclease n=1 Tax=Faunusvirus sp. TaxID=2487766 RepID=A0A3G4ZZI3_9VIRU|nr:MAG: putative phage-type endonuclease [Faunusvirus sp.]